MADFSVITDVKGEKRQLSSTKRGHDMSAYAYQKIPEHQRGGRLPRPYPWTKFGWGINKNIARIPSVVSRNLTTGTGRTLSPQYPSVHADSGSGSIAEVLLKEEKLRRQVKPQIRPKPTPFGTGIGEIIYRGTKKGRRDALRDIPFMGQPVRKNIRKRISNLPFMKQMSKHPKERLIKLAHRTQHDSMRR